MIPPGVRILVAVQPVDFRGSFDRLAGYVHQRQLGDPRSGTLYVFFNKRADKIKVLFFDQTGDCILYKRLDGRTFRGVVDLDPEKTHVQVDPEGLKKILLGAEKTRKRWLN